MRQGLRLGPARATATAGGGWSPNQRLRLGCLPGVVSRMESLLMQLRPLACDGSDAGDCVRASGLQLGVLNLGLYLTALGMGGLKSSVSGFGSDQFDEIDRVLRNCKFLKNRMPDCMIIQEKTVTVSYRGFLSLIQFFSKADAFAFACISVWKAETIW
ncbi:hypothetical protein OPV22_029030 [Ensete ventricosum]|uniref:Uncharacterized protein n=1 Tax=Ensete ventricosum TaxID=4639 RepID=A0AAV8PZX3_ENSVE|nr:hypothetical protein OPV22_029030 [Ensete ventricosum]